MNETIINKLREIEQQENIRILHAVESGSRAWGFASPDSDYDVRFIYVRPLEYYLRLEKTRDVIELPINDELDINGWDLDKTLHLLYKSNPTLFEWFASPIIYHKTDFVDRFTPLLKEYFTPQTSVYHYLGTAKSNYVAYIRNKNEVKAKKYFYVLRPLLACRWIMDRHCPPPMLFSELQETYLDKDIESEVSYLLDIKMNSPEIRTINPIKKIWQGRNQTTGFAVLPFSFQSAPRLPCVALFFYLGKFLIQLRKRAVGQRVATVRRYWRKAKIIR